MVIKKLSVTACLSFLIMVLLTGSNLIENLPKMIAIPSAINVIHCIGWVGIGIFTIAFMLFDKPKVTSASDFAKPLFVLSLCIWACYYPRSDSLYVAGGLGVIYLVFGVLLRGKAGKSQ